MLPAFYFLDGTVSKHWHLTWEIFRDNAQLRDRTVPPQPSNNIS